MEFLVEFEVKVPDRNTRRRGRAALARRGVRGGQARGRRPSPSRLATERGRGRTTVIGLYAADSEAELDGLLCALPLADWMQVTVIPLAPHPNDRGCGRSMSRLPEPRLTLVYRLEAVLGEPLDLGEVEPGAPAHRPADRRHIRGARHEGTAAAGRKRRLAERLAGRDCARRHPLHAPDRHRRSALRPIARRAPRQPRGPRPSPPWRGRRRERVHLPDHHPDRDRCTASSTG